MVITHPTDYGPEPSVSELQAQIFRLEGEVERLRAVSDHALRDFIRDTPISEPNDGWAAEVGERDLLKTCLERIEATGKALEAATIERCAQVARESFKPEDGLARAYVVGEHIAKLIDALKDKS